MFGRMGTVIDSWKNLSGALGGKPSTTRSKVNAQYRKNVARVLLAFVAHATYFPHFISRHCWRTIGSSSLSRDTTGSRRMTR